MKAPLARKLSELEQTLLHSGVAYLAGVDEVGRGCLAGPVVAASVIYPTAGSFPAVADSKLLSPQQRAEIYEAIITQAVTWSVAAIAADEIDRVNIHQASLKVMRCAVTKLNPQPDYLLVDGRFPLKVSIPQRAVIRGDRECRVVSAASIVAKVWRDRLMVQMQETYANFQFAKHKGYGTRQHREELRQHGPTPIHRRSFRGVVHKKS